MAKIQLKTAQGNYVVPWLYSPLAMFDLCDLPDVKAAMAKLKECPNVCAALFSMDGHGLRVMVPVSPIPWCAADSMASWRAAGRVLECALGIRIEYDAGRAVGHERFETIMPDGYGNRDAVAVGWQPEQNGDAR